MRWAKIALIRGTWPLVGMSAHLPSSELGLLDRIIGARVLRRRLLLRRAQQNPQIIAVLQQVMPSE